MHGAASVTDHLNYGVLLCSLICCKALNPLSGAGTAKEKSVHPATMAFRLTPNKSGNIRIRGIRARKPGGLVGPDRRAPHQRGVQARGHMLNAGRRESNAARCHRVPCAAYAGGKSRPGTAHELPVAPAPTCEPPAVRLRPRCPDADCLTHGGSATDRSFSADACRTRCDSRNRSPPQSRRHK